jgi:hypothetical protein
MWDEGYGAALCGRDWVQTVAGRFLRARERRELHAGWRDGQRDAAEYRKDMERGELATVGADEVPW